VVHSFRISVHGQLAPLLVGRPVARQKRHRGGDDRGKLLILWEPGSKRETEGDRAMATSYLSFSLSANFLEFLQPYFPIIVLCSYYVLVTNYICVYLIFKVNIGNRHYWQYYSHLLIEKWICRESKSFIQG
jgi:hypothetical protein